MPHAWAVTPARAIAIQRQLAARVKVEPPDGPLRYVATATAIALHRLYELERGASR